MNVSPSRQAFCSRGRRPARVNSTSTQAAQTATKTTSVLYGVPPTTDPERRRCLSAEGESAVGLFRRRESKVKTPQTSAPTNWREAAAQSQSHVKFPRPKMSAGMKLCTHLGVSESVRKKLQTLLVQRWTARPEALVEDFLAAAHSGRMTPKFPLEIEESAATRYRGDLKGMRKETVRIYIAHEMSMWKEAARLRQVAEINIPFVQIGTSRNQRVCQECAQHETVIYRLSEVPTLPICWNCRCIYQPLVDFDYVKWPCKVYHNGVISTMTQRQFERLARER